MECSWMAYKDLVCGRWLVNITSYWLWLLAMNGLSREKISRKMARIMPLGMMVADGNAKFMQYETEDYRLHNISKFAWISMCTNYLRQFVLITQIYRIEYWICKWFKLPVEVTKAMWWKKKKRLVLRGRSLHHGKTPGCSPCILGNLFAIELRFMVSKPKFKSADKLRWEQNQNNRTLKNKEQLVMHTCSQVAVRKIFFVYERLQ